VVGWEDRPEDNYIVFDKNFFGNNNNHPWHKEPSSDLPPAYAPVPERKLRAAEVLKPRNRVALTPSRLDAMIHG
jgi:hypothetical protein